MSSNFWKFHAFIVKMHFVEMQSNLIVERKKKNMEILLSMKYIFIPCQTSLLIRFNVNFHKINCMQRINSFLYTKNCLKMRFYFWNNFKYYFFFLFHIGLGAWWHKIVSARADCDLKSSGSGSGGGGGGDPKREPEVISNT